MMMIAKAHRIMPKCPSCIGCFSGLSQSYATRATDSQRDSSTQVPLILWRHSWCSFAKALPRQCLRRTRVRVRCTTYPPLAINPRLATSKLSHVRASYTGPFSTYLEATEVLYSHAAWIALLFRPLAITSRGVSWCPSLAKAGGMFAASEYFGMWDLLIQDWTEWRARLRRTAPHADSGRVRCL